MGDELTLRHVFSAVDLDGQGTGLQSDPRWTKEIPERHGEGGRWFNSRTLLTNFSVTISTVTLHINMPHDSMSTDSWERLEGDGLGSSPGPITLILIFR